MYKSSTPPHNCGFFSMASWSESVRLDLVQAFKCNDKNKVSSIFEDLSSKIVSRTKLNEDDILSRMGSTLFRNKEADIYFPERIATDPSKKCLALR